MSGDNHNQADQPRWVLGGLKVEQPSDLERIADALERIAAALDRAHPEHIRGMIG